jgi:hypothetical protein
MHIVLAIQTLLDITTHPGECNREAQGSRARDGGTTANGEPQRQVVHVGGGVGGEVEDA